LNPGRRFRKPELWRGLIFGPQSEEVKGKVLIKDKNKVVSLLN
jgi:hypothetical protein